MWTESKRRLSAERSKELSRWIRTSVGSVLTAREGMLEPRRLGHNQNPSPQDPAEFSDTLL